MNWFFDMDKPLMRGLSMVTDLMILNLLTFLCSIPVFTAGAACTAMYTVIIRIIREEEGSILKDYFRAFKANFKKATILWLIFLAAAVVLVFDYIAASAMLPLFIPVVAALGVIVLILSFYTFALLARYENSVPATLKNALMLAIGYFPRTLGMAVFSVAFWVACIQFFAMAGPVLIMFGLSLPAHINALLMNPIFNKLENSK